MQGTVGPREAVSTGGDLVVVSWLWWEPTVTTLVGLGLDAQVGRAEEVWRRELPVGPIEGRRFPVWALIEADEGGVHLVSGGVRLLLAADSGRVLAEARSDRAPVAHPGIWGDELVVPEGGELVGYDRETLAVRWRRPAPMEMIWGLGARPTGGLWRIRLRGGTGAQACSSTWSATSSTRSPALAGSPPPRWCLARWRCCPAATGRVSG